MEIRQLKYFLAVADTRSFVSAAQALYISRQAVSKAIAQLEEELQVRLFMRDSNGAFLTPAGVMFYDRIRAVIIELDGVQSEMRRYGKRYHQHVRLAFSIGTLQLYEKELLAFRDAQKNVQIEYVECPEEMCSTMLLENKADMVISTSRLTDPAFSVGVLYRSRYGVLLQNQEKLSEVETIELQDLSWIPLAGLADRQTEELCGTLQYSGYDYNRLFSLVQEGCCALLLPECLVPKQWDHLRWIPLSQEKWWKLYHVHLQSLEKNLLYRSVLDELQIGVFGLEAQEGGNNDD